MRVWPKQPSNDWNSAIPYLVLNDDCSKTTRQTLHFGPQKSWLHPHLQVSKGWIDCLPGLLLCHQLGRISKSFPQQGHKGPYLTVGLLTVHLCKEEHMTQCFFFAFFTRFDLRCCLITSQEVQERKDWSLYTWVIVLAAISADDISSNINALWTWELLMENKLVWKGVFHIWQTNRPQACLAVGCCTLSQVVTHNNACNLDFDFNGMHYSCVNSISRSQLCHCAFTCALRSVILFRFLLKAAFPVPNKACSSECIQQCSMFFPMNTSMTCNNY